MAKFVVFTKKKLFKMKQKQAERIKAAREEAYDAGMGEGKLKQAWANDNLTAAVIFTLGSKLLQDGDDRANISVTFEKSLIGSVVLISKESHGTQITYTAVPKDLMP